jgi:hypothetical protein
VGIDVGLAVVGELWELQSLGGSGSRRTSRWLDVGLLDVGLAVVGELWELYSLGWTWD